ncbi:MAG: hypothetical protein PHD61_04010 [Bacteroidales bacterium]|nr:hypothetical protein [Lentimicrobiaceae bacterium]MDD5694453.1 hypothetical protein [Bacteroidales bacterium]
MLIILDKKVPEAAKQKLRAFGEVIEFTTSGITYEAISGHPDIFFFQAETQWIVAPNLPGEYLEILIREKVPFRMGKNPVRDHYPGTAGYNAVFSDEMLIHNLDLTDPVILQYTVEKNRIHVSQGYCRCNLLVLHHHSFITSDAGIFKILAGKGFAVLFVDPAEIILPGFAHGFIGGACGIFRDQIFFMGSLSCHRQGKEIKTFLQDLHYEIIEFYDGPLFDGGGALFLE